MPNDDKRLYRNAEGHAWVGRDPSNAVDTARIPKLDDVRWVKGCPNHLLDTEVLTLSPFFPSGRLGACVEMKESNPIFRYPNHPPFAGVVAWMPLNEIQWTPCALGVSPADTPADVSPSKSLRKPRL